MIALILLIILLVHAHDCVDITYYTSLIFKHLFGQNIGAGTGGLALIQ
jgi:hypothetical protein